MGRASMRMEQFDDWAELARRDPEAFEDRRRAVIDAFIAAAPERNRAHLRRLQWRIDMERRRASNPLSACYRIYGMMWESFAGDRGLMAALGNARDLVLDGRSTPPPSAQVLSFPGATQGRRRS